MADRNRLRRGLALLAVSSATGAMCALKPTIETATGRELPVQLWDSLLAATILLFIGGLVWIALSLQRAISSLAENLEDRLRDPRFDRESAKTPDLDEVFRFSRDQLGAEISEGVRERMFNWHERNPDHLCLVYRVGDNAERALVGYFAVLPVKKRAARRMERGELFGTRIDPDDVVRPNGRPAALYIGGIAASTYRARSFTLALLMERVDKARRKGLPIYTRPVTKDGYRLVRKYGFTPIRSDEDEDRTRVVHRL